MTTIAAVQGESWAVVGYDSRVTEEGDKIYSLPKDNGKLFKNGNYLLGAAGDMRAVNLLAYVFKPPVISPTTYGIRLDKFISTSFIPELKKCFEEASYSKDGDQDSQVMCVINGTIYEIGNDYSWARDETGVYAIGSGSSYALGALIATLETRKRTLATAKTLVRQAITIASKLDPSTAPPIYVNVQHFG
jgi:ATP-dependent protease HslVU (ClpYQ) peptidase subunit